MKADLEETPETIMQQAVDQITGVSDEALQFDLLAVLGIISGEKYSADFVKNFIRREMLMQSPVYQEWIEEDIKEAEARAEARAKAQERIITLRDAILEVLAERFNVVKQPLRDKVNAIEDAGVLKAFHRWSIKTASVEEFERQMNDLAS